MTHGLKKIFHNSALRQRSVCMKGTKMACTASHPLQHNADLISAHIFEKSYI